MQALISASKITDKTLIVIEGSEDDNFLKSYIKTLGYPDESFRFLSINGKDKLEASESIIEDALDRGAKVLIIFDADLDYQKSRANIENTLKGLDVGIFLFPDDNSSGTLENLLKKVIRSEYERIFDCFEEYKQCISKCMSEYELPSRKAKIYAYKQVLGILENPFDPRYWDFENAALGPLKNFLQQNL